MREKIKYQLTNRRFYVIEVSSLSEKQIIRDLNNEFDKTKKRNRTYYKHNISLEKYFEQIKREPLSNSIPIEEIVIDKMQKKEILDAIDKLTYLQRETIMQHFYQEKSLRQIARERGVNEKTVNESYHSAIKKLGILLKDFYPD